MATQTLVVISSDLSGEPGASTVKFGFAGVDYEMDLTEDEIGQLEAVLSIYTEKARRTGGRRGPTVSARPGVARPGGAQARTGASSKAIREWARSQGMELPERGRIPLGVQEQYVAAQNGSARNGHSKPAPEPEPEPVVAAKPVRRRRTKASASA